MATDINTISKTAQDQILSAIIATQDAIVQGVRTWSSSVAAVMPDMPTIPGLDQLPKPADTIAIGLGFAEKLLATQREFAEKLLSATQAAAPNSPKAGSTS